MFAEYDEVLNTDEACEALKIGLSTLYKLLKAGKLKGFKCGRAFKSLKIQHCRRDSVWTRRSRGACGSLL